MKTKLQKLLNHQTTISRKFLPVVTIVLVVALGTAVYFSFASTAGILPPSKPSTNIPVSGTTASGFYNFYGDGSCGAPNGANVGSAQCFNEVQADVSYSRSKLEGLPPLLNSTQLANLATMSVDEQQFVLVNMERASRGLPAAVAMTTQLTNNAQGGANAYADPTLNFSYLSGGVAVTGGGAVWCGAWNTYSCDYEYMYNDGPGPPAGTNIDCPLGSISTECWLHRDIILTSCPSNSQLYFGSGFSSTASATNGSYASDMLCGAGTPSDISLYWSTVLAALDSGSGSSTLTQSGSQLPSNDGNWQVASDGGVFSFGNAAFYGSTGNIALNRPVVGMAASTDGKGYWLVAADGGVFAFGDAQYAGGTPTGYTGNFIGIGARTNSSYWLVDSTGQVYTYGGAPYFGAPTGYTGSFVGIATTPDGGGYWLIDSTGQVYTYGDAGYYGAPQGQGSIVGMTPSPDGRGYWEVSSTGGVFSYGDAQYYGSIPGLQKSVSNVVGISRLPDGGYSVNTSTGQYCFFSSTGTNGCTNPETLNKPVVGGAGSGPAEIPSLSTAPASVRSNLAPGPNQAIYATGSDGNVWQKMWVPNVGWSGWHSMGNPGLLLKGSVAYGINQDGNGNIFATGSDGNVWQDWWTGSSWSGWYFMGNGGSPFMNGLTVSRSRIGLPILYATGADGNAYQDYWTGSAWSGWGSLGKGSSALTNSLAAGRNQYNQQDLLATGADGNVYEDYWTTTGWSGWSQFSKGPVAFKSGLAAGVDQFGNENLFATGADGNVYQDKWTGSAWSGWLSIGHGASTLTSAISVTRNQINTNDLFATGANGNVYEDYWTGSAWSGWSSQGNNGPTLATGIGTPLSPVPTASGPIIMLKTPANGASVSISKSGSLTITGTVASTNGVTQLQLVQIRINNQNEIRVSQATSPYNISYNWTFDQSIASGGGPHGGHTTSLSPGTYNILIQAQDSNGHSAQAQETVTLTQ